MQKKISKGFPLTGFLIKGEIFFTWEKKKKEKKKKRVTKSPTNVAKIKFTVAQNIAGNIYGFNVTRLRAESQRLCKPRWKNQIFECSYKLIYISYQ